MNGVLLICLGIVGVVLKVCLCRVWVVLLWFLVFRFRVCNSGVIYFVGWLRIIGVRCLVNILWCSVL